MPAPTSSAMRWARRHARRLLLLRLRAAMINCDGSLATAARRIGMDRVAAWRLLRDDERAIEREISRANPLLDPTAGPHY